MLTLLRKLNRAGLLTVPGACRLVEAVATTGVNLMAVLRLTARLHPRRAALTDDRERLTYHQLWRQSEALAAGLAAEYGIGPRRKVALACRNHAAAVKAIFAVSRLGADLYFVNPEMPAGQLAALGERLRFDFLLHDDPLAGPILRDRSLPFYHPTGPSVERLATRPGPARPRLRTVRGGNIVLLTGGTTGVPKAASRKPSLFDFLPPFAALVTRLHLDECRGFYLAPPVYHSFGIAALALAVVMGAETYLTARFDAARACELVARHRVDAVAVVPLMLRRMLRHDAAALASLRCVVSGADTLTPALAEEAFGRLGPVVYNLYGTAEGGMVSLADPAELRRKPGTVGRAVGGVRARVLDAAGREVGAGAVGRLCVRSAWAAGAGWVETGDLAYRDADGYFFLCGRADDMIVSGGENVYPVELENVLAQHPDVAAAAAVGVPDAEFGQRLRAVVVARPGRALDPAGLLDWLRPRVARHQLPREVEVRAELPYTAVGKPDKKALRG